MLEMAKNCIFYKIYATKLFLIINFLYYISVWLNDWAISRHIIANSVLTAYTWPIKIIMLGKSIRGNRWTND